MPCQSKVSKKFIYLFISAGLKVFSVATLLLTILQCIHSQSPKKFTITTNNITGSWTHYFEECVGSGHATLALRADWQEQLFQT